MLAATCHELRERLATHQVDLIVLDVMLPDGSGLDLCRDLRAQRSRVPIILLTALKEDVDRIIGLEIGADDYLGKPFNPRELVARARAILRRRGEALPTDAEAKVYRFDCFTADPQSRSVIGPRQEEIELTGAEFRVGSLFGVEIPPCDAVTAISEVLNYLFDPENEELGLDRLFRRVHAALRPGGVFVFDVLGPGQAPDGPTRGFSTGPDWAVLNEKEEDAERGTMERRIVSFRKVGDLYRRVEEVHRVRLYGPEEIEAGLRRAGFEVRTMDSYGSHPLGENHAAFVARKL